MNVNDYVRETYRNSRFKKETIGSRNFCVCLHVALDGKTVSYQNFRELYPSLTSFCLKRFQRLNWLRKFVHFLFSKKFVRTLYKYAQVQFCQKNAHLVISPNNEVFVFIHIRHYDVWRQRVNNKTSRFGIAKILGVLCGREDLIQSYHAEISKKIPYNSTVFYYFLYQNKKV